MEELEIVVEEELTEEQLKELYGEIPVDVPVAPTTHGVEESI